MKPDDAARTADGARRFPATVATAGAGARRLPVQGLRAGRAFADDDWIAEEVAVALEFNGVSHAVMLATPLDLQDFALGFSLSEGILAAPHELYGFDEVPGELGITLQLQIASGAFARLKQRRRTMAGRTGCGLCGTESLGEVARPLPQLADGPVFQRAAVAHAMRQLGAGQALQQSTGAVHAAAWCSPQGEVRLLREDVGRHNALDKLVGAMARQKVDTRSADTRSADTSRADALSADAPVHDGFIAITSRASFEMVQKTALAGVRLLCAVSAPTTLAVATAVRAGLTLAGFVRGDNLVVYSHPARLDLHSA